MAERPFAGMVAEPVPTVFPSGVITATRRFVATLGLTTANVVIVAPL